MAQRTVTIASSVGLHARPAALFVEAAGETGLDVEIGRPGEDAVDALVTVLETDVQAPEIAATRRLRSLLRAVGPHTEPAELVRLLRAELRVPVALLDTDGNGIDDYSEATEHDTDLNSDGRPDIVAFGGSGVYTSQGTGRAFTAARPASACTCLRPAASCGCCAGCWTSCRADERAEDPRLALVLLPALLQLPLHAEHPGVAGDLDRLDHPVLGAADGLDALAEPVDRLVVP